MCIYILYMCIYLYNIYVYGGCRKFLLLFGRIGPLALRPCALLRAWFFLPHSIIKYTPNSMVIWWYGLIWYVLRSPLRPLARPCIFDTSISCFQIPISPEDVIERTGFFVNPHIYILNITLKRNIPFSKHCSMQKVWARNSIDPIFPIRCQHYKRHGKRNNWQSTDTILTCPV